MSEEKRVIKKYPNRRLYDTATSCYITLEDVKKLVLENIKIQIVDAKTHDDITRSVLLQIILEEESGGVPMFTYDVLTQIIRFYGHAMQGLMGNYLEKNLQIFTQMQERLQEQTKAVYGDNPMLNNNVWSDFLKFQAPAMQGMLTTYLEQSTNMFVDMQQQLQDRARNLFSGFGFPGYPTSEEAPQPAPDSTKKNG
ncbi:polyhydroxyalkanoate synthesis repressor PhaR [Chitinivorax tropicus]|uniref:Polyhydroxyalkanoate synthesis repressor PhaR n=1 Tax=Chitinivorax tropicus TaxID=714531 RepID=A0A840MNW2_9PROT|nr:polyhydroxyalkanoate synthesis repressor PhaR [Chitinivorax tropicus]MBB5019155.1 polyhydroxyalkanoate synthesis repressor PhaR [Chitinivorax tropicus]